MIRKLRKKFIIINMTLISLVLVFVLSVLCISGYQRIQAESQGAMRHALETPPGNLRPRMELNRRNERSPFHNIRIFTVTLDDTGNIIDLDNTTTEVTRDLAQEAVAEALSSGKNRGRIKNLSLRYMINAKGKNRKIAFADTIEPARSIRNLLLSSLLILLACLTAFFVISLFLSRWALKPVEKAWDQQNQFIADASHELKTPLTVILANLKILLTHKEDTVSGQLRWIENTQTEAARMKELVDNLLFLARSESDTVSLITAPVNLSDMVWNCLLPFESIAYENGITITEEIAPDLFVPGNEGQLKQLMGILLDNACKYAGREKAVRVCLLHEQEKAVLTVTNTGDPVPPEDLEHLFERFYRSDKSRVRDEGGYGLGLSIARTIVCSHNGKISVKCDEAAGITFTVTLSSYASKNT